MAVDFGRDISCVTSLRTGRFATGARLVAEAAYRRITTPRGSLIGGEEEADYGIDLVDMVGETDSPSLALALPAQITTELRKDERIDTVDVDVVRRVEGPAVTYDIAIHCTTAAGPFTLKVSVNDVTVELLGITTEDA
jgi:hypothetical protein